MENWKSIKMRKEQFPIRIGQFPSGGKNVIKALIQGNTVNYTGSLELKQIQITAKEKSSKIIC